MADEQQTDLTALTVQLLSAYVSRNPVPSEGLADLIKSTRAALVAPPAPAAQKEEALKVTPAVSVRKSLASPEHIISLIDGKPYKTLKRHLAAHGLTPDDYRERYGLPKSYPLVAESYSQARRAVAHKLGLGHKSAAVEKPAVATQSDKVTPEMPASESKPVPAKVTKGNGNHTAKKAARRKAAVSPASVTIKPDEQAKELGGPTKRPRKKLSIAAADDQQETAKLDISTSANPGNLVPDGTKPRTTKNAKAPVKAKPLETALKAAHLGAQAKPARGEE